MRMFRSGLLLLTSPITHLLSRLGAILRSASRHVDKTLYIHIAPELDPSSPTKELQLNSDVKKFVHGVYYQSGDFANTKDVRLLLGNFQSNQQKAGTSHYDLTRGYEVVLGESCSDVEKDSFLKYAATFMPVTNRAEFKFLDTEVVEHLRKREGVETGTKTDEIDVGEIRGCDANSCKSYDHVVLGGTFDRLHAGHQILLSEALLLANKSLTIGVTETNMNKNKTLSEMIQPTTARIQDVLEFIQDVKPGLDYKVVPIEDPFGPSIIDPDLECIVVSQETLRGGVAVNKRRKERGLSELDIDIIDLLEDKHHGPAEESKLSSSSGRMRLLGTLLKLPLKKPISGPYIIGMTGGIASGKSSICKSLANVGAGIVDCDKLGHAAYLKGTPTFHKVQETFGEDIIDKQGEIDRSVLGSIVFSNPEEMKRLNDIVWPAIIDLAKQQIRSYGEQGIEIVVLDAAVLLEAGWEEFIHEVWLSIIPRQEAIKRIMHRNKLSEGEAIKRIDSQSTSSEKIEHANVVFSTLWDYPTTHSQIERAWRLLKERIGPHQS